MDERDNVRVLMYDPPILNDPVELFLRIGSALDQRVAFDKIAQRNPRLTSIGGRAGPLAANAAIDHVRGSSSLTAMLDQSQSTTNAWQDKTLVLIIDELQTMSNDAAESLRTLHNGLHKCPIFLIGVGLQHLPEVLARYGISRIADPLDLEPLRKDDSRDAIGDGLRELGHTPPNDRFVTRLAVESHGFPQHIHCYLESALECVEHYGGLHHTNALNWTLAHGRDKRDVFYSGRLQAMVRGHIRMQPVIATMLSNKATRLTIPDAEAAIESAGFNGADTIQDAITHGVLAERQGFVGFSIPSFRSYMSKVLRRHRQALVKRPSKQSGHRR